MVSYSNADLEYKFWAGLASGSIGTIGAKGDPGGIVLGTGIGNVSLNTIIAPGVYREAFGSNTTVGNNWPAGMAGVAGILTVMQSAVGASASLIQTAEPAGGIRSGRVMFKRATSDNGATWSAWGSFNSTRIDETVGRRVMQWDDLNNREMMIAGNTGLRDISSLLANGWTATGVTIMREGTTVTAIIYNANGSAATADSLISALPVGFRSTASTISVRSPLMTSTTVDATRLAAMDISTHMIRSLGAAYTGVTAGQINLSWQTGDAWPASLPGIAIGVIPYN